MNETVANVSQGNQTDKLVSDYYMTLSKVRHKTIKLTPKTLRGIHSDGVIRNAQIILWVVHNYTKMILVRQSLGLIIFMFPFTLSHILSAFEISESTSILITTIISSAQVFSYLSRFVREVVILNRYIKFKFVVLLELDVLLLIILYLNLDAYEKFSRSNLIFSAIMFFASVFSMFYLIISKQVLFVNGPIDYYDFIPSSLFRIHETKLINPCISSMLKETLDVDGCDDFFSDI
jgi:hypothetical protein